MRMISASEANKIQIETIDDFVTQNLIEINNKIIDTIYTYGDPYIIMEKHLSKKEKEKLKSIGYKIRTCYFPFYYIISWQ